VSRKKVGFEVDKAAWETAMQKLEHGEMSERFREWVDSLAYGATASEKARVVERIRDLRRERDHLRSKRDAIERDITDTETKLSNAESRLDAISESDGRFEGSLDTIERMLLTGTRVDVTHPQVRTAADMVDDEPEVIIDMLKERNPDVPEHAFRYAQPDEAPKWKNEN